VLLVTLDTFRADHLGCAGNPTVRTPHLDRLARRGRHWPEAITGIPLTTPSHATILTGRSPRAHGVLKNRVRLAESVPTAAEMLAGADVRTGATVSNAVVLGPALGLDRGFDTYEVVVPERFPTSGEGAETTARAASWLAERGGPGSFHWAHYFDAHLPYLPPFPWDRVYDPDYDGPWSRPAEPIQTVFSGEPGSDYDRRDVRHLAALYAGEISFLDGCVGELVRAADDAAGGRATVIVTADHGEGLWEHERYFGHDRLLYETALRVPLLMAGPGAPIVAGRLIREEARTRDLAPTILGLFGLEPDPAMEGRDLRVEPPPTGDDRQFVAESHPSREGSPPRYALRTADRKVIWTPRDRRRQAFDLGADPGERRDLWGADRLARVLADDLELDLRNRPVGRTRTIDDEAGGPDDETRDALRSLGYVD
jgi:arylsulfatase A-like enzyme